MRSCYNETSVRYFDIRQFTNTMLDIKAVISLFHLWNGRSRLIIVFQVLGPCLSKTRDYVQFWFWWPQWGLGFVPICCVFKKLKLVLSVLNSQNNGPVLLFKTIFRLWNDFSCCLFKLWMARMDMEWTTWKKYLCRNHPRIVMVGDPRSQFRFLVPPFSNIEHVGLAFFSNFG